LGDWGQLAASDVEDLAANDEIGILDPVDSDQLADRPPESGSEGA
jgi:hypothetical protein